MSRSAADATRFTATGPYASSKNAADSPPGPSRSAWTGFKRPSSVNQPTGPSGGGMEGVPPGSSPGSGHGASSSAASHETARQKVERLRAEARATRLRRDASPLDRFLGGARAWADRLHRATVFTLIAASGVAGILTIYSISSLIIYNRRQRELFIEHELDRLLDARRAYVAGVANTEQLELLLKEKEAEEEMQVAEEARKQRVTYKVRQMLFGGGSGSGGGGASTGEGSEASEDNNRNEAMVAQARTDEIRVAKPGIIDALNASKLRDVTGETEQAQARAVQSTETAAAEGNKKKSWTSWLTGR